jgi:hypothetical protein
MNPFSQFNSNNIKVALNTHASWKSYILIMLFQKGTMHTNFDIYAFITTNFDLRYIYTL